MTEKDFLDKVNSVLKFDKYNYPHSKTYSDNYNTAAKSKKSLYDMDDFIFIEWESGGCSGGSCWDSSDPTPYTNTEPQPEFEDLDKVLSELNPNISYLNYKKLTKLVEREEFRLDEYYGNYTDYVVEKIYLKDIFNFLKDNSK